MNDQPPPGLSPAGSLRPWLVSLGLLAGLTLAMFGGVLFTTVPLVLSHTATDIYFEYLPWREFGFDQLRHGNFALWNPHIFCGAPFFGGFQAALLYPPNVLFLILPVNLAINWCITLHVFLAGAFMYLWAKGRSLGHPAAFLAGVIYMFCGANFLHVYSGYLPFLCAIVWPPLLFLAIDKSVEAPSTRWVLLGMFATAMQVLAGNPQSVFYSGVAAAIYCFLRLFEARRPAGFILGLLGIALGGVALSAVQLFTGLQESRDMLRSAGVPYEYAALFSFPPENFLTLLAPRFFGGLEPSTYWGRDYLWEACLFISVTGLVLAVLGAGWGWRRWRISVVMVGGLLLLALGGHTPLFKILYHWVPGFDQFRGNSKFAFLASMFMAMLAAAGMDELLRGRRPARSLAWVIAAVGAALITVSVMVLPAAVDSPIAVRWREVILHVHRLGEAYLYARAYKDPAFQLGVARHACESLSVAGATLWAVALLLGMARKHRSAIWLLLSLAVVEMFAFAHGSLDYFNLKVAVNQDLKQYLDGHPGDYRILAEEVPDESLILGSQDIWGYEPGIVRRYAQLMAFSQGVDPADAVRLSMREPPLIHGNPLFDLFRCRFDFIPEHGGLSIYEHTNTLPHLLLVQQCQILTNRAEIFSTLTNAAFNPRQEVILESKPDPAPVVAADPGQVTLTDSGSDFLTIEADVKSPCILLVTDVYARAWRVLGLGGSGQNGYRILPADWCLRGIPLMAGHHRLRLEYLPTGFVVGKWVSMVSWAGFLGLVGMSAGGGRVRRLWPRPPAGGGPGAGK